MAPPSVRGVLDQAAARIEPKLRQDLAAKPSPYIVKAHDVGVPTDFNTDIPWHLLDKEKDPRFELPHQGELGVFNTNSDVNFLIGFAVGDGAPDFKPKRRVTDHLVNLAAEEVELPGARADLLWLPVSSDTLLAVVTVRNTQSTALPLRVVSVSSKLPLDEKPFDRYEYGITCTAGRLEAIMTTIGNSAVFARYQEWAHRSHDRIVGSLLCTTLVKPAIGSFTCTQLPGAAEREEGISAYQGTLEPGQSETLLFAFNLHRFGPEAFETNSILLYPKEDEMRALGSATRAATTALDADWRALVRDSYRWYERMPVLELPVANWGRDTYCAMELPRGNTWSAQDLLKQPWYTFCRVHGHNPYGWWSYGMHGHEHLAAFVTNLTEPELSQAYLRGQFQVQRPDGFVPYGVNHKHKSERDPEPLATAPLLAWEAWNAYLWSGDRKFLQETYESSGRFARWWRSEARTRKAARADVAAAATPSVLPLQHWYDYIETVRDDRDLATWVATDKAENQEALDLNCYLLNEERTLAEMARELGRPDEGRRWDALANERTRAMQEHLWHDEDGVFYGRDLVGNRWARVLDISTFLPLWCGLATPEQATRIVKLLHDPQAFGTDYPIATLAVKAMPEKKKGYYHWRGANWVEMTWLAILGLKRYGYYDEAARIAEINCRMVYDTLEKTSHFREFYNSLTGEPSDLTDYIWTAMPAAMVVDILFGIRPRANGLELQPALPAGWPQLSVGNLRVRGKVLDVVIRTGAPATRVRINDREAAGVSEQGALLPWQDLAPRSRIEVRLSTTPVKPTSAGAP